MLRSINNRQEPDVAIVEGDTKAKFEKTAGMMLTEKEKRATEIRFITFSQKLIKYSRMNIRISFAMRRGREKSAERLCETKHEEVVPFTRS